MARDMNIGIPTAANLARGVDVQNFENVITAVETATENVQEAVGELKKIRLGTGLVTGVDLNEEDPD